MEFFFTGILVKVYQIPMLFARSTEDDLASSREGTFLVQIYEK
jgi:hypothetical protein